VKLRNIVEELLLTSGSRQEAENKPGAIIHMFNSQEKKRGQGKKV